MTTKINGVELACGPHTIKAVTQEQNADPEFWEIGKLSLSLSLSLLSSRNSTGEAAKATSRIRSFYHANIQ